MIIPSSYQPPYLMKNGHISTIYPALFRKVGGVAYTRERVATPDHDFLDLDWARQTSKRLVVISHGLEGDAHRPYMKGMVRAFSQAGYDVLAWNYRGCSGELNRKPIFYHSGATYDLDFVLKYALKSHAYEHVCLVGFSLGGNLTLKYMGEQGSNGPAELASAVVFSVPLDLHGCCLGLAKPSNFVYEKRFLKSLKNKVKAKARLMPEAFDVSGLNQVRTLFDFDDRYTAPLHGFKDAANYYKACSAQYFLEDITLPTLIVNAINDPLLNEACYPFDALAAHQSVYFEAPDYGGHCGFISTGQGGLYWPETRAVEFLGEILGL